MLKVGDHVLIGVRFWAMPLCEADGVVWLVESLKDYSFPYVVLTVR